MYSVLIYRFLVAHRIPGGELASPGYSYSRLPWALDTAAWPLNALNIELHLDATIAAAREVLSPPVLINE